MSTTDLWNLASNLSLAQWIVFTVGPVVLIVLVGIRKFLRQQWRLYTNLRRPIKIITPTTDAGAKIPGTEMDGERELLRSTRMLTVDDSCTSYKDFDPTNDHCLVVLGYHREMAGLDKILQLISSRRIPLIVYTYGKNVGAIEPAHQQKFNEYPLTLIANFHLTLVNSIFSTLASYPNAKHK